MKTFIYSVKKLNNPIKNKTKKFTISVFEIVDNVPNFICKVEKDVIPKSFILFILSTLEFLPYESKNRRYYDFCDKSKKTEITDGKTFKIIEI